MKFRLFLLVAFYVFWSSAGFPEGTVSLSCRSDTPVRGTNLLDPEFMLAINYEKGYATVDSDIIEEAGLDFIRVYELDLGVNRIIISYKHTPPKRRVLRELNALSFSVPADYRISFDRTKLSFRHEFVRGSANMGRITGKCVRN